MSVPTQDSKGNPEVLYPIIEANLDKLDDNLIAVLQTWAISELSKAEPETAKYIASVIIHFSNLIHEFPLGSKVTNLEISIAGYERSQRVFTSDSNPEIWAAIQNNLGVTYGQRIKGNKAENLEMAIACYQAALEIYTPETFPETRAGIQHNIGKILVQQGRWYDGLACLEKSLAIYRQTEDTEHLQARADTIYQIARTHHLMSNLDKARIHYRDALRIYEHIDNQPGIAACKTGLGRLMISLGFIDDARQELNQASEIYETIKDRKRINDIQEIIELLNHIKEKQLT